MLKGTSGAVLLAVFACAVFATMHALVRQVSAELHPFEIAFFRSLFGLAAVLPLAWRVGLSVMSARNPRLLALRGLLGGISLLTWFYGLSVVPIAVATVLSFTSVMFSSLGASIILKERMRLRRWTAVALGFTGVLIIMRPGFSAIDAGALIILFAAMLWGANTVIVKHVSRNDETVTIVMWTCVWLTVATAIPAWTVWQTPTWPQIFWLALIGTLGTLGTYAWTWALKLADASLIVPVDFSRLVWASAIGFLFFGEVPDRYMWIGGALIIGSTAYIGWRESKLAKAGKL